MLESQISVSSAYQFIMHEMKPRDHQSIYTSVMTSLNQKLRPINYFGMPANAGALV
jgi:hypothetical protein